MSQYDDLKNYASAPMAQDAKMALGIQGIYDVDTVQRLPLGTRVRLADGRAFVYGKAGAVQLAYGKLNQGPVFDTTNAKDRAVTANVAVGDRSIKVTFGAAVTANQYAGGIVWVNDDTGEGEAYTIKTHAAGTTGVELHIYEKVRVAITAGAGTCSVVANPFNGVVICPTTLTSQVVGVAPVTVPIANYAWFQTAGPCALLTNGTIVVGNTVEASATTGGAVDPTAETTYGTPLGQVIMANASTEYSLVNLAIPGT